MPFLNCLNVLFKWQGPQIGEDLPVSMERLSVSWHINFHDLTECGLMQSYP